MAQQYYQNTQVTQAPTAAPYGATVYYIGGQPESISVAYTGIKIGPQPLRLECPLCHKTVVTVIEHKNTSKTHCLACSICFLGGLFLAMIPYCMNAYNKVEHTCPNCNGLLGVYKK